MWLVSVRFLWRVCRHTASQHFTSDFVWSKGDVHYQASSKKHYTASHNVCSLWWSVRWFWIRRWGGASIQVGRIPGRGRTERPDHRPRRGHHFSRTPVKGLFEAVRRRTELHTLGTTMQLGHLRPLPRMFRHQRDCDFVDDASNCDFHLLHNSGFSNKSIHHKQYYQIYHYHAFNDTYNDQHSDDHIDHD